MIPFAPTDLFYFALCLCYFAIKLFLLNRFKQTALFVDSVLNHTINEFNPPELNPLTEETEMIEFFGFMLTVDMNLIDETIDKRNFIEACELLGISHGFECWNKTNSQLDFFIATMQKESPINHLYLDLNNTASVHGMIHRVISFCRRLVILTRLDNCQSIFHDFMFFVLYGGLLRIEKVGQLSLSRDMMVEMVFAMRNQFNSLISFDRLFFNDICVKLFREHVPCLTINVIKECGEIFFVDFRLMWLFIIDNVCLYRISFRDPFDLDGNMSLMDNFRDVLVVNYSLEGFIIVFSEFDRKFVVDDVCASFRCALELNTVEMRKSCKIFVENNRLFMLE
ncbi:hypothetical protein PCE1_003060 [Barthelona sp. PCE]